MTDTINHTLARRNRGDVPHTSEHLPWRVNSDSKDLLSAAFRRAEDVASKVRRVEDMDVSLAGIEAANFVAEKAPDHQTTARDAAIVKAKPAPPEMVGLALAARQPALSGMGFMVSLPRISITFSPFPSRLRGFARVTGMFVHAKAITREVPIDYGFR